jgi:hypothetical protein
MQDDVLPAMVTEKKNVPAIYEVKEYELGQEPALQWKATTYLSISCHCDFLM